MYLRILKTSKKVVNSEEELKGFKSATIYLGFDHALHPPTQNLAMGLGF